LYAIDQILQQQIALERRIADLIDRLENSSPTPAEAIYQRARRTIKSGRVNVLLPNHVSGKGLLAWKSDWEPMEGYTVQNGFCELNIIVDSGQNTALGIYSELCGVRAGIEGPIAVNAAFAYQGPGSYRFPMLGRDDSLADAIRYEIWMINSDADTRRIEFEAHGELVGGLQF